MADETSVAPAPPQAQTPREDAAQLLQDWGRYATRAVDGAEVFARQKPLAALVLAFVAGLLFNGLLNLLFRRK